MKRFCLLLCLIGSSATCLAQGSATCLHFANNCLFQTPDPRGGNRLVYDAGSPLNPVNGVKLSGTQYVAELYAGPDASNLSPLTTYISRFRSTTSATKGTWSNTTIGGHNDCIIFPPGVLPGSIVTLQVRVWDLSQFPTYEAALDHGKTGASTPFFYAIPPPNAPQLDACMEGLQAFGLTAPEEVGCPGVFPIATNPGVAESTFFVGASSGSNFLVPFLSDTNVTAQLISSNGALLGAPLDVGKSKGFPRVTFGNTNYLVAWSDDFVSSGVHAFGQFVSPDGARVGSPFPLTTSGSQGIQAVAFDGANFLVILRDDSSGEHAFYGQFVTRAGTLSSPAFPISNQPGNGATPALAFGRTNYLVAWQSSDGSEGSSNHTYCALVSTNGSVSAPLQISEASSLDNNPLAVAFDRTNYFVVWNRDTQLDSNGSPVDFHLYARSVSEGGTFPGSELALVADPGNQRFPSLVFDGSNYLLTWSHQLGTSTSAIKHRFFSAAGAPTGIQFSIFSPQSPNRPYMGATILGSQHCLAIANLGSPTLTNLNYSSSDIYGALFPTSITPPKLAPLGLSASGQFSFRLTGTPGISYGIQVLTNIICSVFPECFVPPCPPPICAGKWSTILSTNSPCGALEITDPESPSFTRRLYRAIKQN